MNYTIREMKEQEYPLLREFLYEAIFVPEDMEPPSKEILDLPELQVYFDDFGYSEHDNALVAEIDGEVVGAVWSRIMDDYGHIDDSTPSISPEISPTSRWKPMFTTSDESPPKA